MKRVVAPCVIVVALVASLWMLRDTARAETDPTGQWETTVFVNVSPFSASCDVQFFLSTTGELFADLRCLGQLSGTFTKADGTFFLSDSTILGETILFAGTFSEDGNSMSGGGGVPGFPFTITGSRVSTAVTPTPRPNVPDRHWGPSEFPDGPVTELTFHANPITLAPDAGDLLLATISVANAEVIVPPAGWLEVDQGHCPAGACTLGVWFKVAGPSEPSSYLFSWGTAQLAGGRTIVYQGVDQAKPIDAAAVATGTSDIIVPSVTTTVDDAALERVFVTEQQRLGGTFSSQASAGPTGPYTVSGGSDGPAWRAVMIAIRPAAKPPIPTPPPVGGIALDPDLSALALETPSSSSGRIGVVTAIAAGATGAVALAGAAWVAGRRRAR